MAQTIEDVAEGAKVAVESIPVVMVLVSSIAKIINAKENAAKQLDALQTAAEAVKARMDELKFPGEASL